MLNYPAWKNGKYCKVGDLNVSVLDLGLIHCDATYDVIAVKNNQIQSKHYFQLLRLNKQHLINKEDGFLKKLVCNFLLWTSKPSLLVSGHLFRHDICTFIKSDTISDFEAFQAYQLASNFNF